MKLFVTRYDGKYWTAYDKAALDNKEVSYICHSTDRDQCAAVAESFGYIWRGDE